MTTDEFKKEIKEQLGLKAKKIKFYEGNCYEIIDDDYNCYAWVYCNLDCIANVDGGMFLLAQEKQRKLFKIVTEYAATPIKERNPKRYFQYRLKQIADHCQRSGVDFLNYSKNKERWFLEDYRNGDMCQTIFEENDPVLNNVNLDIFDAIEVDADGNEVEIDEME